MKGGKVMSQKALKIMNTCAFVLMVAVNALANLIPLGIGKTGDVSKKYPNLFTPAPYTFAIWGIIYIFMALFVIYQWGILDNTKSGDGIRERIGIWFVISCVFNVSWVFAWHFDVIWLSLIFTVGLLISLIMINRRIADQRITPTGVLGARVGYDIYFGWIIAATIANVSVLLTQTGWNRFGLSETFWTVAILLVGAVIGSATVLVSHKWLSALTVIWAYAGILVRHLSSSGYDGKYPIIITTTIIGIIIIGSSIFIDILRKPCLKNCSCKTCRRG